MKLKVLELFGGIGACSKALERLNIDHKVVDYVEIDKYAVKSYNAIHGTNFEPQDITQWDKDIEVDLICGGFPCQDISLAGKQKGIIKGETRSGLMYEMMRIIHNLKPKYVIAENVKNILSERFRPQLEEYLCFLNDNGYRVTMDLLNAKDYVIPQSRERIFIIGVKDEDI
jgi:DNA (cytosine-5)-methyltransferase 1